MNSKNNSLHKDSRYFVDDFYKNISTFVDPVKMPINNRMPANNRMPVNNRMHANNRFNIYSPMRFF